MVQLILRYRVCRWMQLCAFTSGSKWCRVTFRCGFSLFFKIWWHLQALQLLVQQCASVRLHSSLLPLYYSRAEHVPNINSPPYFFFVEVARTPPTLSVLLHLAPLCDCHKVWIVFLQLEHEVASKLRNPQEHLYKN